MARMKLQNAEATVTIEPDGGRLASLIVRGHELLVTEGDKPTRWGSFPMVPWCGRLPYGRLEFGGERYAFPITSAPHANHGRGHLQQWEVVDEEPSTIALRTELGDPWPFGGHVVQRFTLTDAYLVVGVVVHTGERAMPAMAGWHPWFRRVLDGGAEAQLRFAAQSVYSVDDDLIPTGELEPVPPPPWNACFVGVDSPPVIEWPGAVTLAIESTFDHWVIFTEPDHALCVEPQSGPPNQFHLDPYVLEPGDALAGSMTLRWR